MDKIETYKTLFNEYPDVLDVKQVSKILKTSTKTVYKIIKTGELYSRKVGRDYKIAKISLIEYFNIII